MKTFNCYKSNPVKLKYLIFFIGFVITFKGKSQENHYLKVPLKTVIGIHNFPFKTTSPINIRIGKTFDYKMNSGQYTVQGVGFYPFDYEQYLFELYKFDRINGIEFIEKIKKEKIDTLLLSKQKVNCYVGVFVGLTGSKKKIIIDVNNNHDFTDDTVIEYDTVTAIRRYVEDSISLATTHSVSYEYFKNGMLHKKNGCLKLLPYHDSYNYIDKIKLHSTVYIVPYQHKEGSFLYLNQNYKVVFSNNNYRQFDNFDNFIVNIQDAKLNFIKENFIKRKNLLNVDKHYFQPINCSQEGDTLLLKYWGFKENPTGWQVGNLLPEMESKDTLLKSVKLNNLWNGNNKKYLLLDFWGSWCGPCIASIPELKSFYQENNKNIDLISVDMEYNDESVMKAKKIINDKKMNWTHLMEKYNQEKGIVAGLNIQSYPTMILVSPEGVIIAKEIGLGGIKKIKETYEKYLSTLK